jgi:hypothetical protein
MWQTQTVVCTVLCLCACVFLQHCWGGVDLREGCVLSFSKVRRQEETICNCKVIKLH